MYRSFAPESKINVITTGRGNTRAGHKCRRVLIAELAREIISMEHGKEHGASEKPEVRGRKSVKSKWRGAWSEEQKGWQGAWSKKRGAVSKNASPFANKMSLFVG